MTFGSGTRSKPRLARTSLLLLIALSMLVVIAIASTVTVTRANDASYAGTLIRPYFENQNAPVTGCTAPCLTVDTQTTQPGTSGSFALSGSSSMYLWSPQFATATTAYAGTWALDFWASAASYSYVPVTLTNGQASATPNPLQVEVTWNPSSYSGYESSTLGNIRFCTSASCSTEFYSWLQSCTPSCSNSATSASAWVKLTSSISGSGGTLTIYMVFLPQTTPFDGNYWGEAPTLSATYAQYDNGANVFTFYDNFAGTSGPNSASWTTSYYGSSGTATTNNMLIITCAAHSAYNEAVVENTGVAAPSVAEADVVSQSGNQFTDLGVGSGWDNTANGVANNGYTISWNGQSGAQFDKFWVDSSGARTQLGATSAGSITSLPAGIWGVTWYATGNEVAHDGVGNPGSFTETDSTVSLPTTYVMVIGEASSSGAAGTIDVQWARMRAFPPGNTLPSVTLGSISSDTLSVSIYITNAAGTSTATVASNVQSPTLGTSKSEYGMTFSTSQENIPAHGYISFVIVASAVSCTIYWGTGQPTDFQVSYTSRTS
jgi:hypothetical protein